MGRMTGKRCVVTGAAQGIAWAVTQAYLKEGAEVMAVDVNADKLNSLPKLEGLSTRVLDVRDRDGVMRLAEEFLGVDVLFNCAGYVHMGNIMDVSEEDWDKTFDINVKSMLHFIQAFVPQMKGSKGGGSVINMASVVSSVMGLKERSVYGASKGAVIGLTKGLAAELIRDGVRVNVVCPGAIATDSYNSRSDHATGDVDHAVRRHYSETLIGRVATPDEITGLFVYLASDESLYNTGSVFLMDGGFSTSVL